MLNDNNIKQTQNNTPPKKTLDDVIGKTAARKEFDVKLKKLGVARREGYYQNAEKEIQNSFGRNKYKRENKKFNKDIKSLKNLLNKQCYGQSVFSDEEKAKYSKEIEKIERKEKRFNNKVKTLEKIETTRKAVKTVSTIIKIIVSFVTAFWIPILIAGVMILFMALLMHTPIAKKIEEVVEAVEEVVENIEENIEADAPLDVIIASASDVAKIQYKNVRTIDLKNDACKMINDFCYDNYTFDKEKVDYVDIDYSQFWETEGEGSAYQFKIGDYSYSKTKDNYNIDSSLTCENVAKGWIFQDEDCKIPITLQSPLYKDEKLYDIMLKNRDKYFSQTGDLAILDGRILCALPQLILGKKGPQIEALRKALEEYGVLGFGYEGEGCGSLNGHIHNSSSNIQTSTYRGIYIDMVMERPDGAQYVVPLMAYDAKGFHHNYSMMYGAYDDNTVAHISRGNANNWTHKMSIDDRIVLDGNGGYFVSPCYNIPKYSQPEYFCFKEKLDTHFVNDVIAATSAAKLGVSYEGKNYKNGEIIGEKKYINSEKMETEYQIAFGMETSHISKSATKYFPHRYLPTRQEFEIYKKRKPNWLGRNGGDASGLPVGYVDKEENLCANMSYEEYVRVLSQNKIHWTVVEVINVMKNDWKKECEHNINDFVREIIEGRYSNSFGKILNFRVYNQFFDMQLGTEPFEKTKETMKKKDKSELQGNKIYKRED